jgi:hypothetical protein
VKEEVMKNVMAVIVSVCLLTIGCAKLDEKFTLNPDGSGSYSVQLELIPQTISTIKSMEKASPETLEIAGLPGPIPMTEADIRALADENVAVKDAKVEDLPDGGKKITASFEFKDITKFAASKPGHFLRFELKKSKEGEAKFAASPFGPSFQDMDSPEVATQMKDEKKRATVVSSLKLQMRGFIYRLEATLPGKILSSNAKSSKDNNASWTLDVDTMTDKDLPMLSPKAVLAATDLKFTLPVRSFKTFDEIVSFGREKAPAHPADQRFGVALNQLSISRTVDYQNDKPSSASQHMSLQLKAWFPEEFVALAYTGPAVEEAVTDTGESIASEPGRVHRPFEMPIHSWRGEAKGVFDFSLSLSPAKQPFKSIKLLKGSVELKYAASVKTVEVPNARQWAGKQIGVPGLEKLDIEFKSFDAESVTIRYGKETEPVIKSAIFKNAEGEELDSMDRSTNNDITTYRVSLPEDGSITFEISQDVQRVTIPFELKDVLLEPEPEKLPF